MWPELRWLNGQAQVVHRIAPTMVRAVPPMEGRWIVPEPTDLRQLGERPIDLLDGDQCALRLRQSACWRRVAGEQESANFAGGQFIREFFRLFEQDGFSIHERRRHYGGDTARKFDRFAMAVVCRRWREPEFALDDHSYSPRAGRRPGTLRAPTGFVVIYAAFASMAVTFAPLPD
jgi:hypothetical protein